VAHIKQEIYFVGASTLKGRGPILRAFWEWWCPSSNPVPSPPKPHVSGHDFSASSEMTLSLPKGSRGLRSPTATSHGRRLSRSAAERQNLSAKADFICG